ncbi:TetR/AcrR family transcriptional regulator, partial [Streptomyces sp. NPDC055078]
MTGNGHGVSTGAPTRNGSTRERGGQPDDRRATIQWVAAELFAERGYAATGVGDIADRVGLSPGVIYRHFSGKDDLLRSILEGALADFTAAATLTPETTSDTGSEAGPRGMVFRTVDLTLSQSASVATYLREWQSLSEAARHGLRADERHLSRLWETAIRGARPTVSHGDAINRQRAVNGVLGWLARRHATLPQPRTKALLIRSLLALLLAPPDRSPAPSGGRTRPEPRSARSRRKEIRDAAACLFRQYGYHGVGIDRIGRTAGISGPRVYATYAGKAEILVDVCDHAVTQLELAIGKALEGARSPEEALNLATRAYVTAAFAEPDAVAVAAREGEALPDGDRLRMADRRDAVHEGRGAVLAQVRTDLDEHEARTLVAGADAAVQEMALVRGSRSRVAAATDLVLRFMLS